MKSNKNNHYHDLDQSGLLTELGREAFTKNIPLFTTLELTQDCNFRCHHCYNFDRTSGDRPADTRRPLGNSEWLDVIDQVMDAGAFYVCFTGGEVLLYSGLWELVDRVTSRSGLVKLKTNGAVLSEESVRKISSHRVSALEISLYGMSEQTYATFTGKSGMFQRTVDGIERVRKTNASVTLNIILNRINFSELSAMIEFAERNSLPFNFSDEITKRYDGTGSSTDYNLTDDQYRELLRGPHRDFFLINNEMENHSFQCACARNVCGIGSTGDIYPCIGAPIVAGNIREDSFVDVWKNAPVFNTIRGSKNKDFKECTSCAVAEFCNRSSGSAYVNTTNYYGCDPQSLRLARLRQDHVAHPPPLDRLGE